MDFSAEELLEDYHKIIDGIVNFIIKTNKSEYNPVEAIAIENENLMYRCSYITFGCEDRHPAESNNSIWSWWDGDRIVAKIMFSNREQSLDIKKVIEKVNKVVINLLEHSKKVIIKNKLQDIENDFN